MIQQHRLEKRSTHLIHTPKQFNQITMSAPSDPFYDFMCRHLSIREWDLYLMKQEYSFLQACGGVTPEDMARFRTGVMGYSQASFQTAVVIKQEPPDSPQPALISLKSMLLEIITREQTDNINKICRHVRPLLDREGIRTFCRHHATHVRSADSQRVRSILEREGMISPEVVQ
jgi:hypothetical protein